MTLLTRRELSEQSGVNLHTLRTKRLYQLGIKPEKSEVVNGKYTHLYNPDVVEEIKNSLKKRGK